MDVRQFNARVRSPTRWQHNLPDLNLAPHAPQELHCWLAMSEHARDEPWLRDDGGVPHRVGLQEPRVRCQLAVVSADDARKVRGALVAEVGLSENLHIVW